MKKIEKNSKVDIEEEKVKDDTERVEVQIKKKEGWGKVGIERLDLSDTGISGDLGASGIVSGSGNESFTVVDNDIKNVEANENLDSHPPDLSFLKVYDRRHQTSSTASDFVPEKNDSRFAGHFVPSNLDDIADISNNSQDSKTSGLTSQFGSRVRIPNNGLMRHSDFNVSRIDGDHSVRIM